MALLTLAGVYRPNLYRLLIDRVIMAGDYRALPWLALGLMAVAGLRGLFNFTRMNLGALFGQQTIFALRQALYHKLQHLSFRYYERARTGDLMSRLTADVEVFRQFLAFGFVILTDVIFMFVFSLAVMFWFSWQLTLVTLATMPLLLVAVVRFENQVNPAFRRVRESLADLTAAVQENISGQATVKAFARESNEVRRFAPQNESYLAANLATGRIWARYFPLIEFLSGAAVTLLLLYGGYLVIEERMTLGVLVAFFSLVWYLIWPIREVGWVVNMYTQSAAAGQRLLEVLHAPVDVDDRPGARPWSSPRGHVRLEGVSFSYDGRQSVLCDIDLDVPPGGVVGILGETGSGKSTLVNLIPRFYDVSGGRVLVDGADVRDLTLASLRARIGYVGQDPFLWSATVRENIAYGRRDALPAKIEAAARLAGAHEFICELPQGYDTVVGERGVGLSGGQKQRVALARALLIDPCILILDDATSAVDMETEQAIQAALREMRPRTTLVIAHRIASLRHAGEILVMAKGRIVERGTHAELLRLGGRYRAIYDLQHQDIESEVAS